MCWIVVMPHEKRVLTSDIDKMQIYKNNLLHFYTVTLIKFLSLFPSPIYSLTHTHPIHRSVWPVILWLHSRLHITWHAMATVRIGGDFWWVRTYIQLHCIVINVYLTLKTTIAPRWIFRFILAKHTTRNILKVRTIKKFYIFCTYYIQFDRKFRVIITLFTWYLYFYTLTVRIYRNKNNSYLIIWLIYVLEIVDASLFVRSAWLNLYLLRENIYVF